MNHVPEEHLKFLQNESARRDRFGEVRPLIHADWRGQKWVAVGNEVFHGDWRFFPDFLADYIKSVLTPEWGKSEIAKSLVDRHPIMQWYDGMCHWQRQQAQDADGTICFKPDGHTKAYMLLAYDLYTLRHHQALQSIVVRRLKHNDQFQGARYELFIAATCIRAGYTLEYEDESDRSKSHSEFRATHRTSGEIITVEGKSRHRSSGSRKDRIVTLLNNAIKKAKEQPHVIFIDLNLPTQDATHLKGRVRRSLDQFDRTHGAGSDPFNLIVFTNHPFHSSKPGEITPLGATLTVFGRNPTIAVRSVEALTAIHDAALKFGDVPQKFEDAD